MGLSAKGKNLLDWNDPTLGSLLLYAPVLPGSLQYRGTGWVPPIRTGPEVNKSLFILSCSCNRVANVCKVTAARRLREKDTNKTPHKQMNLWVNLHFLSYPGSAKAKLQVNFFGVMFKATFQKKNR